MIIISDTSAITNLAAIDHLHLLPKLYDQVKIPEAVYRELTDVEPPVPGTLEVQSASWIEVKRVLTLPYLKATGFFFHPANLSRGVSPPSAWV
ncbi:MAG: hypothetical protein ACR9NN_21945 [Nostochopsis sp.]